MRAGNTSTQTQYSRNLNQKKNNYKKIRYSIQNKNTIITKRIRYDELYLESTWLIISCDCLRAPDTIKKSVYVIKTAPFYSHQPNFARTK